MLGALQVALSGRPCQTLVFQAAAQVARCAGYVVPVHNCRTFYGSLRGARPTAPRGLLSSVTSRRAGADVDVAVSLGRVRALGVASRNGSGKSVGAESVKRRKMDAMAMAGGGSAMEMEAHSKEQMRLMFEDECILVDADDNVVGHDSKYNCHLMEKIDRENLLHRAFSVFLFNSKNELLMQQRAGTKVTFPFAWTNTCCSHPLYRESELISDQHLGVRNAAQRKLLDELGIPLEQMPVDNFDVLGRIHYKAASNGIWGEHEVDYLLITRRDVALELNPDEVAAVRYVDRAALREIVRKADAGEDGIVLSPWFRLVVDKFLFEWWDHLEAGTLESIMDAETIHRL